jgi:hypothetical protein
MMLACLHNRVAAMYEQHCYAASIVALLVLMLMHMHESMSMLLTTDIAGRSCDTLPLGHATLSAGGSCEWEL